MTFARRLFLALPVVAALLLPTGAVFARTNQEAICDVSRRCFSGPGYTCGTGQTCVISVPLNTACSLSTVGQGRCMTAEQQTCLGNPACLSQQEVTPPAQVVPSACCKCRLGANAPSKCVTFSRITSCSRNLVDSHTSMAAFNAGRTADQPIPTCDEEMLTDSQCVTVANQGVCPNTPADIVTVFTNQVEPATTSTADAVNTALTGALRPPITPNLNVPIPGLKFATPNAAGGTVQVNFLGQYVSAIYRYAVSIVLVVATIMIVYGGFLYLISPVAGKADKGKTIIKDALLGMIVLLSSYLILATINPALVDTSKSLSLDVIQETDAMADSQADDTEQNANAAGTANSVPTNQSELCTTAPARDAAPAIRRPFAQAAATCQDHPPTTIPTQITAGYCGALNMTVSDGSIRKRMQAKVTLVPFLTGSARDHLAWCANCSDHFACSAPERTDESCVQLAGRNGEAVPCAGGFGLFLRGMTANCHGKRFDRMDGLDGLTFGIQDTNAWDLPRILRDFDQADHEAFMRSFAGADLNEWYSGGTIRSDWFCEQQVRRNGLACNINFRRGLEAAMRERGMIKAQLQRAYSDYVRFARIASSQFRSIKGQAMFAAWMNNPGRCGGGLGPLIQACGRLPEEEKYECFLREAVNVPCRNNATGAASRATSIRQALANIPFSALAGEIEPLDAIINRCLR